MTDEDDETPPMPPPTRGAGDTPWQFIVRCRHCDLMGEADHVMLTRDPVNRTIGVTIWVNEKCPRCGHRNGQS